MVRKTIFRINLEYLKLNSFYTYNKLIYMEEVICVDKKIKNEKKHLSWYVLITNSYCISL